MSRQPSSPTIFCINFAITDDQQSLAVDKLLSFYIVYLYPLHPENQGTPDTQSGDKIKDFDAIVIDNATNDPTKHIVHNLVTSWRWSQVSFTWNVDDNNHHQETN